MILIFFNLLLADFPKLKVYKIQSILICFYSIIFMGVILMELKNNPIYRNNQFSHILFE